MGVSGSGKSTVGARLADDLGLEFIEGDEHHSPANVEKMAAGIPLTDEDRGPWLRTLAGLVAERHSRGEGTVLACSALRRAYRDVLRAAVPLQESFAIQLDGDAETLRTRVGQRRGHYMPRSLLASQLATLEPLEEDEPGAVVDASGSVADVTAAALSALNGWHGTLPAGR